MAGLCHKFNTLKASIVFLRLHLLVHDHIQSASADNVDFVVATTIEIIPRVAMFFDLHLRQANQHCEW